MKVKSVVAGILYSLFRANRKAAQVLGVRFGKNCKFIGNPISTFGSEPWAITIGDNVEITNGVQIITHDGALWVVRSLDKSMNKADIIRRVNIGNCVFIGTNAVILPGVSIGSNVIIGAGSVVTHDIPDNSVAVGVPATVIKSMDSYINMIKKTGYQNTKGLSAEEKRKVWEKVL